MRAENQRKLDSQSFDSIANLYDTYRPGYPDELIEDIIRITALQAESRLLEIGCGTGKATLPFAQRGYTIVCLEPGQNLLEVAAQNLQAYPRVSFIQARFEEWQLDQPPFDLVFSAQAYHWIPVNVRYEKTAAVLKPGGYLAAIWNLYPGMGGEIRPALDQVYRELVPELVRPEVRIEEEIEGRARTLRESPYFENVVVRQIPWSAPYTTQEYVGLLNTYSDHLRLPESRRQALFAAVTKVIEQHGGIFERPYLAVVYLAQKAAD